MSGEENKKERQRVFVGNYEVGRHIEIVPDKYGQPGHLKLGGEYRAIERDSSGTAVKVGGKSVTRDSSGKILEIGGEKVSGDLNLD